MSIPTENWPKPWLLQVHAQAVEQGFIWLEPISKGDAESLKQRFYRIRRRSDKSMAAFIPPEYHLVMMGNWEQLTDGSSLGRVPVIYNQRADGVPLPIIRAATGEEIAAHMPAPKLADPAPIIDIESLDVTMKPGEIDDFVGKMTKKVKGDASDAG